jgi:hypothetical protein
MANTSFATIARCFPLAFANLPRFLYILAGSTFSMTKRTLILLFLAVSTSASFGQRKEFLIYENIYHAADSLDNLGRLYSPDSSIIKQVKKLDKKHPSGYFLVIGEAEKRAKYDDAAFLYYLAILRYKYYNRANPKYEASGDGALLASLKNMAGEPINMYLKTNIDNFVAVLKCSGDYFANHDYRFYLRAKSPANYDSAATLYTALISDIQTNREKYRKQWDEERSQFMKRVADRDDNYNKLTPEEKKWLDPNNR